MARTGLLQTMRTVLLASALYAASSTLYAVPESVGAFPPQSNRYIQPQITASEKSESNTKRELPLPLTQQTPDFYKSPAKEFQVYRTTYASVARDGVLDHHDIRALEHVLSATLNEISAKTKNQHGSIKDSFPATLEGMEYLQFVERRRREASELSVHLERFAAWQSSALAQGKFWHEGYGLEQYRLERKGNPGLTLLLNRDDFYYNVFWDARETSHNQSVHVMRPDEECLPQRRLHFLLGLTAGLLIPAASFYSGIRRIRRIESLQNRGDTVSPSYILLAASSPTFSFVSGALGSLLIDWMHPLAYPLRVAIPAAYEGSMQVYDALKTRARHRVSGEQQTPQPRESVPPALATPLSQSGASATLSAAVSVPVPEKKPERYDYIPLEPFTETEAVAYRAAKEREEKENPVRRFFFKREDASGSRRGIGRG